MQLIKIYADRVQIKSDNAQLGDIRINNAMLLTDTSQDLSLVCMVTAITRDEEREQYDFDGTILEPEATSTIDCSIIGSLRQGRFTKSVDTYPTTNVQIEKISDTLFSNMVSERSSSSFPLGRYSHYDCDAYLDGNKLFQRHSAIVGNTGSGKSFTVASILEKLAQLQSANVILFDLHGEYSNLSYVKSIKIGEDGLSFPIWFLPFRDLYGNLLKMKAESAQIQVAALRKAFYEARDSDKSEDLPIAFSIEAILEALEDENEAEIPTGEVYKTGDRAGLSKTVKGDLNGKLTSVIHLIEDRMLDKRYRFMMEPKQQNYLDTFIAQVFSITEKNVKVIDLSDVPNDMVPTIIAVTAKLLYKIQLQQDRRDFLPLTLICDEAHNYIPSSEFGLGASQRRLLDVFETIAKEGRKFGVSLVVISQRPSELNRTILAQCANFIVLKMSNETDKQIIKGILPDGSKGILDSINLFQPGDCLVIGDSASITFKIRVDMPSEEPNSSTVNTWDIWSLPKEIDTHVLTQRLLQEGA